MITDEMVEMAYDTLDSLRCGGDLPSFASVRSALEAVESMLMGVPDGWLMVPVEPTDAMLSAPYHVWQPEAKVIWKQMLIAAPKPAIS